MTGGKLLRFAYIYQRKHTQIHAYVNTPYQRRTARLIFAPKLVSMNCSQLQSIAFSPNYLTYLQLIDFLSIRHMSEATAKHLLLRTTHYVCGYPCLNTRNIHCVRWVCLHSAQHMALSIRWTSISIMSCDACALNMADQPNQSGQPISPSNLYGRPAPHTAPTQK